MKNDKESILFARNYVHDLIKTLQALPLANLSKAIEVLKSAYGKRKQVFLAGNGGSAATASHMANDLVKGVAKNGAHGFRAIALSDNIPLITAIANDENYDEIFASQLKELAQPGDVLIVFSGSGQSPNIVRAVEMAAKMKLKTVAFLGMGGGRVAKMADVSVIVPSDDYGPIEDIHLTFDHLMTAYFRKWVGEKNF